jgi:hypothetical protein
MLLATLAAAVSVPACGWATTGTDLSSRIVLDGRLDEYAPDEWVLDAATSLPERRDDSVWGSDNDVARIALTWDREFLYVAVECVTLDSQLFLFVDHAPGGVSSMESLGEFRRAIAFASERLRPDVLVAARPASTEPEALRIAAGGPRRLDSVRGRFVQEALDGGALEVAFPWSLLQSPDGAVSVVAAVTGGPGSGCGDVAPDPYRALGTGRSDPASIDRALVVDVDADDDGVPDAGVSPRGLAGVENAGSPSRRSDAVLDVALDVKSFVPDDGEVVTLTVEGDGGGADALFMSALVYSRSGELVRVLFRDERRDPRQSFEVTWDGRGESGGIVAGGIYVINLSWGDAPGVRGGVVNAAVAVLR